MSEIKQQLLEICSNYLEDRIDRITASMKDLSSDLENETKSSAGDKYETGREMINLEWNKLAVQLQQFKQLAATLKLAKESSAVKSAKLGSLVITSNANYLLAIPVGEIELNNKKYFAIGTNAPIAQVMLLKGIGDNFQFNGRKFTIVNIE